MSPSKSSIALFKSEALHDILGDGLALKWISYRQIAETHSILHVLAQDEPAACVFRCLNQQNIPQPAAPLGCPFESSFEGDVAITHGWKELDPSADERRRFSTAQQCLSGGRMIEL